jgi:quinol monooxygenase YgiN
MKLRQVGTLSVALWITAAQAFGMGPSAALSLLESLPENNEPVSVVVRISVKEENIPAFLKLLPEMKAATKGEKGNVVFVYAQSLEKKGIYSVYSEWKTKTDLQNHLDPTANAELKKAVGALLTGSPEKAIDLSIYKKFE